MEIKNNPLDIYKGKRVFVTGSTGFKGSWLCLWLKSLGADVFGYALPALNPEDNFARLKLENQIFQDYGDIRDLEKLKQSFKKASPDFAFHLAAQALVLESYAQPHLNYETNLMGTVNFFEAVRSTPSVKVAINITSDKCYQNNEQIWPYRECDPMGGKDPYSASKACSELITQSYMSSFFSGSHVQTAAVASARAGNVIGAGDWAKNRIIPDFFRSCIKGESLEIRNPGAIRPWQHVLEPLNGYLQLGSALYKEGEKFSGAWNFGPESSCYHSVKDLIEGFIKIWDRGSFHSPEGNQYPYEANLLKLDISKAVSLLHWAPVLNFEQTLEFTLRGYIDEIEHDQNDYQTLHNCRLAQLRDFEKLCFRNGK